MSILVSLQMALNDFNWNRCRQNMDEAKQLWQEFPRKENLNPIHVQNIDVIFYCIFDTLQQNDVSNAAENQMQMLLTSLDIAFRILLS